jgi:hypothetical protein
MAVEDAAKQEPESDSEAFKNLRDKLLAQHEGKFALIHAGELSGIFDSMDAAYAAAIEKFGAEPIYIGRILNQPRAESIPALIHGLIHARI